MNLDQLLNVDLERHTLEHYITAVKKNFNLCGSRLILSEPDINEHTDWDFWGRSTDDNRTLLAIMGFHEKFVPSEYMDDTTMSVWIVNNFHGKPLPIQVVLKKVECTVKITKFWSFLKTHPTTFKELFWKSYTVDGVRVSDQDKVRANINHWMKYVVEHLV